jgi:hypothetical protein
MKIVNPWRLVILGLLVVWPMMAARGTALLAPPGAGQEEFATLSGSELDALVAPIALYPDALVAQILGAATYPDQVVQADTFIKANYNLTGEARIKAMEAKPWDPSVQALVQFPSVLDKLSKNIEWTSALGDAAANQQGDVMAAIQRMRAKAYAAGNLKSGEQIKVVKESPDVIVIQPANPQVVYVPTYNPTVVYGAPVTTPGYSSGDVAAAAIISFGVGVAVGAAVRGPSCGWSYSSWGMNWHSRAVYCGGGVYYGNPYWWGGYYPGYYPGYRPPYYPPGNRPPRPTPLPEPAPGKPGRPSTLPAKPGGPTTLPSTPTPGTGPAPSPGSPTTRPGPGVPSQQASPRELRGYPSTGAKPAPKPNAFSGTVGGRPESARGNRSMSAPAARPSEGTPRQ